MPAPEFPQLGPDEAGAPRPQETAGADAKGVRGSEWGASSTAAADQAATASELAALTRMALEARRRAENLKRWPEGATHECTVAVLFILNSGETVHATGGYGTDEHGRQTLPPSLLCCPSRPLHRRLHSRVGSSGRPDRCRRHRRAADAPGLLLGRRRVLRPVRGRIRKGEGREHAGGTGQTRRETETNRRADKDANEKEARMQRKIKERGGEGREQGKRDRHGQADRDTEMPSTSGARYFLQKPFSQLSGRGSHRRRVLAHLALKAPELELRLPKLVVGKLRGKEFGAGSRAGHLLCCKSARPIRR